MERIPKQALTSGWSIIIQCEEIDRETGERFQEVIGFNKVRQVTASDCGYVLLPACGITQGVRLEPLDANDSFPRPPRVLRAGE